MMSDEHFPLFENNKKKNRMNFSHFNIDTGRKNERTAFHA